MCAPLHLPHGAGGGRGAQGTHSTSTRGVWPALHIPAKGTSSVGQSVSPALTDHDKEAPHAETSCLPHSSGEDNWGFPPVLRSPSGEAASSSACSFSLPTPACLVRARTARVSGEHWQKRWPDRGCAPCCMCNAGRAPVPGMSALRATACCCCHCLPGLRVMRALWGVPTPPPSLKPRHCPAELPAADAPRVQAPRCHQSQPHALLSHSETAPAASVPASWTSRSLGSRAGARGPHLEAVLAGPRPSTHRAGREVQ